MLNKWIVAVWSAVTCTVLSAPAGADPNVTRFDIDVDARIDSRDPNHNFGVSTTARVIVNGDDGSLVRSLIRLPKDMWSIPGQDVISAKVYFYLWRDSTGGRTVRLHPVTRWFEEGTGDGTPSGDGATWETWDGVNAWTTPGGDYDPNVFVEPNEGTNWFCWDITSMWDNTDLRSHGAVLRMNDESDPGDGNMPRAPFTSSDGTLGERPYVEVVYGHQTLYRLTVKVNRPEQGHVELDPEPSDANDPQYPAGTTVTLTAFPAEDKVFKWWEVYDPNHPRDTNYATFDTNDVTTIVMDTDMFVKAKFMCGSGLSPFVPGVFGIICLWGWRRVARR
jgi:hypothetical protein